MSSIDVIFQGSTNEIFTELDESELVAKGITNFTLIGGVIDTEFEDENGNLVVFPDALVTIIDRLNFKIAPTAALTNSLENGLHTVRSRIVVGGATTVVEKRNAVEVKDGYKS